MRLYLTKENIPAVAEHTWWSEDELETLLDTTEDKWIICISGIRAEK